MSVGGFLIAGFLFLLSVLVLPIAVTLLTEETRAWLPHLTRALIRSAARRLPAEHRDRYTEEWLAEAEAYSDRPLTALVCAFGVRRGARRLGRELTTGRLRVPLSDRAAALVMLISVAPVLGVVALLIRLESPGPVLFRQMKRTHDGVPYEFWSFRTIARATGEVPPLVVRTRVGRLLARSALDNLPFLLSVLLGNAPLNPTGAPWWRVLAWLSWRRER